VNSPILSAAPLLAALAWTIALILDGAGRDDGSVLLMGVGLLIGGVVSVVGLVVSGGRWARRLGFALMAACALIALIRPFDGVWGVAMLLTAFALVALNLPGVTDRVRRLPGATGPPARAIITSLLLLAAPFLIGASSTQTTGWPELTVGLSAPLAAFLYARVIPGGLWAVRLLWPLAATALAWPMGLPASATSLLLGVAVAVVAWDPSVKVAFSPPRQVGSTYPIPPELTPPDILDAAQLDDRGRPK
jgi:hypothetical protein